MVNVSRLHISRSAEHQDADKDASRAMAVDCERMMTELLPALALASSLPCLWDEMQIFIFALGCTDLAFIDLTECDQPRETVVGTFAVPLELDEVRRKIASSGGKAVLHGEHTLALPAFGTQGLEAVLSVRLAGHATTMPRWAPCLAAAFQLAFVRHRQLSPPSQRTSSARLSQREREIMQWVIRGKSNSVIGLILDISPGTVDTYMRRIFRKLEVGDRTSAAMRAIATGEIA